MGRGAQCSKRRGKPGHGDKDVTGLRILGCRVFMDLTGQPTAQLIVFCMANQYLKCSHIKNSNFNSLIQVSQYYGVCNFEIFKHGPCGEYGSIR